MFDAAIYILNLHSSNLITDPQNDDMRSAIRVLEAAALILPLINIPADGEWYHAGFDIKVSADGPSVDNPSFIRLLNHDMDDDE